MCCCPNVERGKYFSLDCIAYSIFTILEKKSCQMAIGVTKFPCRLRLQTTNSLCNWAWILIHNKIRNKKTNN